jgi:spore maturation protein CgeB
VKIFRICPAPFHIEAFRKRHRLKEKSFDEQIELLRAQNMLLPGGWAAAMEREGFEVFETIYNDWALQGCWASEYGHKKLLAEPNWQFKILLHQVKQFQPDAIFIYAGALFWVPRINREQLRAVCKRPVIVTGFWGDELFADTTYADYFGDMDYVFCSSSRYAQHFRDADIPASTIGNPFDDTIQFSTPTEKTKDFIFSGVTGYGFPDHIGRYEKLIQLMRKSRLQIWANEPVVVRRKAKEFALDTLARCPRPVLWLLSMAPYPRVRRAVDISLSLKQTELPAADWFRAHGGEHPNGGYFGRKAKPLRRLFRSRVHKQLVDCSEYYRLVAESKLVLNLHRDEDADIGNIRCFEVTGLGSCLVTDRGTELREFFDVENDIVSFETADECAEKVNYLLQHPEEIERIARNGQRKTLSRHTVGHRCKAVAAKLKELTDGSVGARRAPHTVIASYDLDKHPISYDFAFFLQAAEIFRKQVRARRLVVEILHPLDIDNIAGVSREADRAVDAHGRAFRIFHICTQLTELLGLSAVVNIKNRAALGVLEPKPDQSVLRFPTPDISHHSGYYRIVNENPELVTGLSASVEAQRYVRNWLDTFQRDRKLLCVTLRQYRFDPQRNSNLESWAAFLKKVDPAEFAVVVVPDTDQLVGFAPSALGHYPAFAPACFGADLRFALYEAAYLNMCVNTGPGVAAFLDKKVRCLMFKIVVPNVPHCTVEFIKWNGFEIGGTPKFATPFQKWVWADDDVDVLWREFTAMDRKIAAETRPSSAAATIGQVSRVNA